MSSFNFNPLSNLHLMPPNAPSFLLTQQSKNCFNINNNTSSGPSPMDLELESQTNCEHNNDEGNSEIVFNGMMGIPPQSFMMLPMMDPSLLQQFPVLNIPTSTVTSGDKRPDGNLLAKEIIQCPSCTLIPPNPTAAPPSTRERPLGCKTCFIGGLPENITSEIIHEIFERCGEITTLRLSKKNFCHIRFAFETSVDSAIYLSGYRVKIGNNNDPGNTGKLHVDYAQARDDQYEYECRLRQLQREQRHKQKDRTRSCSPHVVHYTDHEATSLSEKLKSDETFFKAVQTLIAWLERGDCTKRNANIFYSMIQNTNSHVRRLLNEKSQHEDELKTAKEKYNKVMSKVIDQFNQIEKVFNAASHKNQKVWDQFTKPQRKNISSWCKQAMDGRAFQKDDIFNSLNDQMETSDEEAIYGSNKRARLDIPKKRVENSRRNQTSNDNRSSEDSRDDRSAAELKEKQIKVFQETIRNLQRKLIETNTKERQNEAKITELEEAIRNANVKELLLRTKVVNARASSSINDDASETSSTAPSVNNELQLISLATAYLVIHPKGADLDPLLSYVQQFIPTTNETELCEVLSKNPKLFSTTEDGSGWLLQWIQ